MAYGNKHPNMSGLQRHTRTQQLRKANRLVAMIDAPDDQRRQILHRDEQYMDLQQIEAYIEVTLGIETGDITERTKAVGPALKLLELKEKLHGETNPLMEEI